MANFCAMPIYEFFIAKGGPAGTSRCAEPSRVFAVSNPLGLAQGLDSGISEEEKLQNRNDRCPAREIVKYRYHNEMSDIEPARRREVQYV